MSPPWGAVTAATGEDHQHVLVGLTFLEWWFIQSDGSDPEMGEEAKAVCRWISDGWGSDVGIGCGDQTGGEVKA